MFRYFVIYKPFQVLSQFSAQQGKQTLKDFFIVPRDVYPVGRLDYDSEGLLILTSDSSLNHRLLNPVFAHPREYLVQVEGVFTSDAAQLLGQGVSINVDGKAYKTRPAQVSILDAKPLSIAERIPPVRFRRNIPTSWIRLSLTEGKNRQVRKMTAAAGYPTLRLIRSRMADLELGILQPGQMYALDQQTIYKKLFG